MASKYHISTIDEICLSKFQLETHPASTSNYIYRCASSYRYRKYPVCVLKWPHKEDISWILNTGNSIEIGLVLFYRLTSWEERVGGGGGAGVGVLGLGMVLIQEDLSEYIVMCILFGF